MRKPLGKQFCRGDVALPFREAVQVDGIVYVSGHLALDDRGAVVGDDIEAQTSRCLGNIGDVLERCGLTLADVFKVTAWLTRPEDFAGFNRAFAAAFGGNLPVRSTVRSDLLVPGALVELEVLAHAGERG